MTRTTDPSAPICRLAMLLLIAVTLAGSVGCESNSRIRERGLRAMNLGQYDEAAEHFARAAERQPTDFRAQYYLGVALLEQGEPLRAQLALEKALAVAPDHPEWTPRILDQLAESLYRQGRFDALHAFLAGTVRTYGTTDAYLRQAEYLARTGDLDGAKVAYRKAAYFAPPDDPTPYLAVADFYESLNDVPNAVAALRYAYYVDPDAPGLAERFRRFGIVPGPTVAEAPPKPEMLQ